MTEHTDTCRGCISVYYRDIVSDWECKHTRVDIKNIPDCPCKVCLIKGICIIGCDEFKAVVAKHKDNFYDDYKITKQRE